MTECDALNIHGMGKIQSFGYLVSIGKVSMEVCHVSENIFNLPFSELEDPQWYIGNDITSCFSEEMSSVMLSMLGVFTRTSKKSKSTIYANNMAISSEKQMYSVLLDESSTEYVFEIFLDLGNTGEDSSLSSYSNIIESMITSSCKKDLFEIVCSYILEKMDYDRAIVYAFSEDMSGEVVYEWIKPEKQGIIDPYIGMRFPESDIPLPARMMYILKPIRIIRDTQSDPVKLIGRSSLNLSRCITRASHDVHISYMKNMGIRSSMSIGVMNHGDLWGIISFHNYDKIVEPTASSIRIEESICNPLSMILERVITSDNLKREKILMNSLDGIFRYGNMRSFISENYQDILEPTRTSCIILYDGKNIDTWGENNVFLYDDISELAKRRSKDGYYIGRIENPSRGVIYSVHGNIRIIIYRKSFTIDSVWGGDPNYVKMRRPDGVPGPRGSFERYIIENDSKLDNWTSYEKDMVSKLFKRFRLFLKIVKDNPLKVPGENIVSNSIKDSDARAFLLTHMSHELLTPLTGISNNMSIVLDDKEISREEIELHMTDGMGLVNNMKRTISGMISSRIENEKSTLKSNEVSSIEVIIDSLVSRYTEETSNIGIHLSSDVHVESEHDMFSGKTSDIMDSLVSVVENSIKFTQTGGTIKLGVLVHSTHREAVIKWKESTSSFKYRSITNFDGDFSSTNMNNWYTFTIDDTGIGVHQDMMDGVMKIIDESYTGSYQGEVCNSHQGMSLGLYKGLIGILQMGGSVAIASTLGVGMSISLFVPLFTHTKRRNSFTQGVRDAIGGFKKGIFFIVDDSATNRKMTMRLINIVCKKLDVDVEIRDFPDGRVCMEEVMRMQKLGERPLGILMDYHMPVMSGKEATERIRQLEIEKNIKKIPIIGYSADVTERTRRDLLKAGMNGVIPKPISMDTLTNMFSDIIQKNMIQK